ncbi:uncharacterized protein LOC120627049 [Pararge aegeria]|uniref:Jg1523 protein n=1 Tax=Pararge aegeria aegeria TaxID=348720 RepID=A0A8S4RPX6_9NEOP|nr:uncharacterized protein LOC120627049 [Pararge aegeria]CAH2239220.1 jg1523 [Pararge aegeria aegeria]
MRELETYTVTLILVFSFVVHIEAVTVNPLAPMCPTNKIAPRRKRYDNHPRTFGEFYNLLTPNSPSNSPSLQEQPQEDVPDDCGEIDDYDENDIGSLTQRPAVRRQGQHRFYFNKGPNRPSNQYLINQHNQYGIRPSTAPANRPTRPPPAGYFGTNSYTPPKPLKPTDYVKPVHEAGQEPQIIYRPGIIVGGPLGHIVGLPQNHGLKHHTTTTTIRPSRQHKYYDHHRYVPSTIQSDLDRNRHHRPRKYNSDTGILGSFADLFF